MLACVCGEKAADAWSSFVDGKKRAEDQRSGNEIAEYVIRRAGLEVLP